MYNILLDKYSTVNVNNMICETLKPSNIVSLLYKALISQNEKNNIIKELNNINNINNDSEKYLKIYSHLKNNQLKKH
jgi:hypothetical protein